MKKVMILFFIFFYRNNKSKQAGQSKIDAINVYPLKINKNYVLDHVGISF